jgi:hypothetical protein
VTVIDELSGLSSGSRETRTVNGIIEASLKQEQQVLAGDTLHSGCALEIISELSFKDEIDALDLLLFA